MNKIFLIIFCIFIAGCAGKATVIKKEVFVKCKTYEGDRPVSTGDAVLDLLNVLEYTQKLEIINEACK